MFLLSETILLGSVDPAGNMGAFQKGTEFSAFPEISWPVVGKLAVLSCRSWLMRVSIGIAEGLEGCYCEPVGIPWGFYTSIKI